MKYCVMIAECKIVEADSEDDARCLFADEYKFAVQVPAKAFEVSEEHYERDKADVFDEAENIATIFASMAEETEWHAFGKDYEIYEMDKN